MNFTHYDIFPEAMLQYMRYYGPHFNRKLCEFATSKMKVQEGDKTVKLKPYSKEEVDNMLSEYKVKLKNNQLYDAVYVANMGKADYLNSSIVDTQHLVKYIKDTIDDVDAEEGLVFNRWYADMSYMGIPIDWEEML